MEHKHRFNLNRARQKENHTISQRYALMFYIIVAVKLILGLLALVLVINLTGKGNLAPASASD